MNQIKIQIIGSAGSGKSTLAWAIAEVLEGAGICVEVIDHEDFIPEDNHLRLDKLYERSTRVQIETVDANRRMHSREEITEKLRTL